MSVKYVLSYNEKNNNTTFTVPKVKVFEFLSDAANFSKFIKLTGKVSGIPVLNTEEEYKNG